MSLPWAIYYYFLDPILMLFVWVIIIGVVLSWLLVFRVVNPSNQFVVTVYRFTQALTEPLLRPLRAVIPPINGVDLSPVLLILGLYFVRGWLLPEVMTLIAGPSPVLVR